MDYQEPEETNPAEGSTNADTIPEMKDPLEDDVTRRPQSTGGGGGTRPMPEFTINPNLEAEEDVPGEDEQPDMPGYEEMKKQEAEMTDDQVKEGARFTADFLLEQYSNGWVWLGHEILPISEKKIQKLKDAGVDMKMPIQYGDKVYTAETVIAIENAQSRKAADALAVDQKTRDKVAPIIASELAKRGMVMPPLVYVALVLGIDAGKKIKKIMRPLMKRNKITLEALEATNEIYRRGQTPQAHAPAQPVQQPAAQTEAVPSPSERAEGEVVDEEVEMTSSAVRSGDTFKDIQKRNRNAADRAARAKKKAAKKTRVKKPAAE